MRRAKSLHVLEKSVAAAVSAIEIYNKPDFRYRGETFSILMVNAWELLLKAKILKDNGNNLKSILVLDKRRLKDGNWSKRLHPRKTRSGNPATLSLGKSIDVIQNSTPRLLDQRVVDNVFILVEIRDNSIHLINQDLSLESKIQEVGTAALRNYVQIVQEWFNYDLSRYNFFLMPLSFFHEADVVESFSVKRLNDQTRNLLEYLKNKEEEHPSETENPYNVTLKVETKFVKSSSSNALAVRWTDDPSAPQVRVTEEDNLKGRFDYRRLTDKMKSRYSDFKENKTYHELRKQVEEDDKYCHIRRLDPQKQGGTKKKYYSSKIFKFFDQHYTRS